ncbi:MAG: YbaN family protein [Brevinema sp.]
MNILKLIYLFLGSISLGLGVIGILIPILPTTPFLLLTLFCYAKGSERFHTWFINTKIYEKHLKTFAENRSLPFRTKIILTSFATGMMLIPFFTVDKIIVKGIMMFLIIFLYYYFIFHIKTSPSNITQKKTAS